MTQDLSSASLGSGVNFFIKMQIESGTYIAQKVKCVIIGDILGSQDNGTVTITKSTYSTDGDTTMTLVPAMACCSVLLGSRNYTKTNDTLTVCDSPGLCVNYK